MKYIFYGRMDLDQTTTGELPIIPFFFIIKRAKKISISKFSQVHQSKYWFLRNGCYVERLWLCISSSSIKVPYIELEAHRNCYWLHFYHSKDIKFTRKRRGQKPSKDLRFYLCRQGLKTAPRASNFFPNKCDPSMNTPSIYVQDRYEGNSFIFHTCQRFSYASWSIWLFSSLSKLLIELKHILDVKLRA